MTTCRPECWFLPSVLLIFVACQPASERTAPAATERLPNSEVVVPEAARATKYECNGGNAFTLYVLPETAWVQLPNRTVRLPRDETHEGTRYSNGSIDFSVRNGQAQMETEEMTYTGCRSRS